MLAMPLAVVEEIRRLRPEEIEDVGGKLLTKVRGVVTEVVRIDGALGLPPIEPINGYLCMVIVRAAGRQVGVVVEEVLGKDEVVIKNLGQYLRRVKLFPGATVSPDGSLILLVDVNRLAAADAVETDVVIPSASAARVFAPGAAAVVSGSIPAAAVDELGAVDHDRGTDGRRDCWRRGRWLRSDQGAPGPASNLRAPPVLPRLTHGVPPQLRRQHPGHATNARRLCLLRHT